MAIGYARVRWASIRRPWTGRCSWARPDRGRYEIQPERGKKELAEELILGTGRRGADFYDKPDGELLHLTNWIDCVRSRKQPTAPVSAGVWAAAAAHLANQALRTGQTAE